MKRTLPLPRRWRIALLPLVLMVPGCSSDGWDPTENMGNADGSGEVSWVMATDGPVDVGTLGALGRYIRGQRKLNRSEKQILESLAGKQIGGYRVERLRVLERKRESAVRSHRAATADLESRRQAKVERIRESSAPAAEKSRQLDAAEREYKADMSQADAGLRRELELIDTEITREKRKTYMVAVKDPKSSGRRTVVLIDANNRVKNSKVYEIDRPMVDLARIAAREEPDVAVLTNVAPLRLPAGL
jgi:hypothetical protein